jgi:hypothetical protein
MNDVEEFEIIGALQSGWRALQFDFTPKCTFSQALHLSQRSQQSVLSFLRSYHRILFNGFWERRSMSASWAELAESYEAKF